jgi:poly(A) polymerase
MQELGIGPGPMVGKAYHHLLGIRMERGPLPRDEAVAELHRWAATQDSPPEVTGEKPH